jgi:hypothetical protein
MSRPRFALLPSGRQLTRSARRRPRCAKIWQKAIVGGTVSAMGRQICILLILTPLFAEPAVSAADPPPQPGRCPNAIKPLPRSVNRAVDRIMSDMYPELREKLLATKREDLPQFQEWDKGIRNQLCLEAGGNDQLMRSACKGELCHPETASQAIMEAVWDRLQSVKKVLRPGQPIPKFAPAS